MKKIYLSQSGTVNQGKYAIIDDCDYPYVSMFNWQISSKGYATRSIFINGKEKRISLHKFIWYLHNGVPDKKYFVDHISRNRLDDRIENLRLVTAKQNATNRSKQKNNTSGFRGVTFEKSFDKRRKKNYEFWRAVWYEGGKDKHKRFDPTDEGKILAARFVDKMNLILNTDYAGHLNLPNEILSDEEFEKLLKKKECPFARKVRIKETGQIFDSVNACKKYLKLATGTIYFAIKNHKKVKGKYTIEYI